MNERSQQAHTARSTLATLVIAFMLLGLPGCGGDSGNTPTNTPPPMPTNTPTPTVMPTSTPTGTPHTTIPDWAQGLASGGASWGLEALLDAAGLTLPDFLVDNVVGSIMGKLFQGGSSPDTQMLNQIYSTLSAIQTELTAIANQLSDMEKELALDTSEINTTVQKAEMDPYVNQIDTLWESYQSLRSVDPITHNVTWNSDPQTLQGLASDLLACSGGVYPQLVAIHNLLTQEGGVSTGTIDAMRSYAQSLVINGNADPFNSYMMIENYFGMILKEETMGATLMVEAMRYREANPQSAAPGDCPANQNAAAFMAWYATNIEDQVEIFLNETEHFVTSTAYPKKGFENFVPEGTNIFYRADLVAAWLSSRHRLDPTKAPDGQQFLVYRVIGGPDRVSQYGLGFPSSWGTQYTSTLYNGTGNENYSQTANHSYSDLRPGTSPYVQFLHPLDQNGGAKQKGALADATQIATGKYVTAPDSGGEHGYAVPYYLHDIPQHTTYWAEYQYVNSSGERPQTGDAKILFGYVFEMQQPPAMLMGDWDLSLSHDSQSGLQSLGHEYDGNPTPGSQYVHFFVDAWPTVDRQSNGYSEWYNLSGNFQQEYAMVGHYYWGGSTCCPVIGTNYAADMAWNVQNDGSPAGRSCGTLLWVQRADQSNSYGDFDYHSVGSGTDHGIQGRVAVNMVPGEEFYVSLGAHMFADWDGQTVSSNNDWHHWYANYTITLDELHFDLPQ